MVKLTPPKKTHKRAQKHHCPLQNIPPNLIFSNQEGVRTRPAVHAGFHKEIKKNMCSADSGPKELEVKVDKGKEGVYTMSCVAVESFNSLLDPWLFHRKKCRCTKLPLQYMKTTSLRRNVYKTTPASTRGHLLPPGNCYLPH